MSPFKSTRDEWKAGFPPESSPDMAWSASVTDGRFANFAAQRVATKTEYVEEVDCLHLYLHISSAPAP